MDKFITFLSKLGFWRYVMLFTVFAVLISEFLILLQNFWSTGNFLDKDHMIVGFITPTFTGFIVFLLSAYLIRYLTEIQKQLQDVQEVANIGFWELDVKKNSLYWSDEVYKIFGLQAQEFTATYEAFLEYVHPGDRENLNQEYVISIEEKRDYKITHRVVQKSGSIRYVEEKCKHYYDNNGQIVKSVGTVYDVTERVLSSEKMQRLFDLQTNIIIQTNGRNLKKANQAFLDFFGFSSVEDFLKIYTCICDRFITNDKFFHLGKVPEGKIWTEVLEKAPEKERIVSMLDKELAAHAFSISINHFEDDDFIVSFSDISETILEHLSLQKKVFHDSMTNAYNRYFFENNIKIIRESIYKNDKFLGLIMFDVDKFKDVNDTFGHNVGDDVLKTLVKVVKKSIREKDILIRWGGEEFIVVLEIESLERLQQVAEHIRTKVEKHHFDTVDHITCSFGVTLYKQKETIDQTIERADQALYMAKNDGRNLVRQR
ncbi:diguanylate cyclase [bacterium]|nr:diguanylate cyclase [bacterium]MBU1884253.1 diguanylate cyclase [bacterium]